MRYDAIAEEMRRELDGYTDGQQIPTHADLVERFGATPSMVQRALAQLRHEGLIVATQGSGAVARKPQRVVRETPKRLDPERLRQGESIWDADTTEQGRSFSVDMVEVSRKPADQQTARDLKVDIGALVCVRRRRYLIDDRPVQFAVSHLPWDLVSGTDIVLADTGPGGIYARLAEIGHGPVPPFIEDVLARMPTPKEAALLALPDGVPLIVIKRLAFDAERRPVETQTMRLDSGHYLLRYEV